MRRLGRISPAGAPLKEGKYNTFVTFWSTRSGRTVAPILTLNGSNDVFPPKDGPFWGHDDGWRHMKKYAPKTPPKRRKWVVSSQNAKIYTSQYLRTINPTNKRFKDRVQTRKPLSMSFAITSKQIQYDWRPPSWKSIWRHISAVGGPIWTTFGNLMQNNTPITVKWLRSKPEVKFQYGGRLFFQTRSTYI